MSQIGNHFPKFRDENKKCVSCHHHLDGFNAESPTKIATNHLPIFRLHFSVRFWDAKSGSQSYTFIQFAFPKRKGKGLRGGPRLRGALRELSYQKIPQKPSQRIQVWYIYTYMYHKNQPNVGKYTIHGSFGLERNLCCSKSSAKKYYLLLLWKRRNVPWKSMVGRWWKMYSLLK